MSLMNTATDMTCYQTNFHNKTLFIKVLTLISICLSSILPAFSQEEQESTMQLSYELPTAVGERKIDILTLLALRIDDVAQAKKYATEALTLAQSIDYKDGIASAYIGLGEASKYILYAALPTDSLSALAKKYNTSVESIMESSHLLDEAIFEGQSLKIQTPQTIADAENYFVKALEIRKLQKFTDGEVWALLRLAKLAEVNGAMEKAEKYYVEIVAIREKELNLSPENHSNSKSAMIILADFYFRRFQQEKVPSEKVFFLQKEDEIRNKILALSEKYSKQKTDFLVDIMNTGNFYWHSRGKINKAEIYLKRAVAVAKEIRQLEDVANGALWDFYKKQGRSYFASKDFELSEQFFKNYIQTVENYYTKKDSLAYQHIADAYFYIADFYKVNQNHVGSDIYILKCAQIRLKQGDAKKLKWLKNRLLTSNLANILLDSAANVRTRQTYSEDFKAILTYLPTVNNLEIKQLMTQKIIDLGAKVGNTTQMLNFYSSLLNTKNIDSETKVKLHFSSIEIISNQGNTAEINRHYQQIITLVEASNPKNNFHYFYLAKAYKGIKNKQKAIDNAWKAIRTIATTQTETGKNYLNINELQQAKNILAELMKFDEVTDSTFVVHTVESGETLNTIQSLYNISENCLKEWNYLDSNELVEGMKLKVCKKADWIRNRKADEILPTNTRFFHIVNRNETLVSIAQKYNKTVQELQLYNNNALNTISLGQKIWVGKYFMQCGCE